MRQYSGAFVGIDPGKCGAVSVVYTTTPQRIDAAEIRAWDVDTGDASAFADVMREVFIGPPGRAIDLPMQNVWVGLEVVHSMPREAAKSAFSFGRCLGVIQGVLWERRIGYTLIEPSEWVAYALRRRAKPKDRPARKKAVRAAALATWPHAVLGKPSGGSADALWMAALLWSRKVPGGGSCV